MIPWFVTSLLDWVAGFLGYQLYVRARSGNWWGAERVYFVHNPDAQRIPKLSPRRADVVLCVDPAELTGDPWIYPRAGYRALGRRARRRARARG